MPDNVNILILRSSILTEHILCSLLCNKHNVAMFPKHENSIWVNLLCSSLFVGFENMTTTNLDSFTKHLGIVNIPIMLFRSDKGETIILTVSEIYVTGRL